MGDGLTLHESPDRALDRKPEPPGDVLVPGRSDTEYRLLGDHIECAHPDLGPRIFVRIHFALVGEFRDQFRVGNPDQDEQYGRHREGAAENRPSPQLPEPDQHHTYRRKRCTSRHCFGDSVEQEDSGTGGTDPPERLPVKQQDGD